MSSPKRRYPPNNVTAQRKQCRDCAAEGLVNKRKAPHPGPRCASHHRAKRLERRTSTWEARILALYGLSADEYRRIWEYQGGRCYICQRANGSRKRLSVDHDHDTGFVRGLLCLPCNRNVLGHARDDIAFFERAIDYLTNPPAVDVIGERVAPIEDLT